MFLIYRPDGEPEQRFVFKPDATPHHEAEAIEKRTSMTWAEFGVALQKGSTIARRALLWILLRRQHPALRFDDVAFTCGQVEIQMDAQELRVLRDQIAKHPFDDENLRSAALAEVDQQIRGYSDPDRDDAPKEADSAS